MEHTEQSLAFVLGLDLGKQSDYTALVVDERVKIITARYPSHITKIGNSLIIHRPEKTDGFCEHRFRHIQRFALKTTYPDIVSAVGKMIAALKAQGRVVLIVDYTGVGTAVVDMFRLARYGIPIKAVTITGGHHARQDPDSPNEWTVPKKDLVGVLQSQFHQERIKIVKSLPEAKTLMSELQNFRAKTTDAANMQFEAWRDGDHDDLVLAAAFAVWGAERFSVPGGLI